MTHPTDEDHIAPIAMKAGEPRVIVKGRALPVDFRIIAEDEYQKLRTQLTAANARADRAEAERAAQIEAGPVAWVIPGDDHEDCNGFIYAMAYEHGEFSRPLYASQPHDRTALDRLLADAEAKALRRAAYIAANACLVPPDGGNPTEAERLVCDEACNRILAMIPKEGA